MSGGGRRLLWRWGLAALLSSSLPLLEDRHISTSTERWIRKVRAASCSSRVLLTCEQPNFISNMESLGPSLSAGLPNKTCAGDVGGSAFLPSCPGGLPTCCQLAVSATPSEIPWLFPASACQDKSSKIRQPPPCRLPNGPVLPIVLGLQQGPCARGERLHK